MANGPGASWPLPLPLPLPLTLTLAVAIAAATLPRCDPASPPRTGVLLTQPPMPNRSALPPPLARMIEETVRVVELNPDDAAGWGKLGGLYLIHDFTAESVVCLEQAAQRDPGEFRWPYLVGQVLVMEDHAASLNALRRARALRDDYAPLELLIGRALFLQGDLDDAEAAFRRALGLNDRLARGHLGLGQIALERGDAAAAVTALERARELGVGSQEVHWALATAHRRHGDAAAAARAETAAASATVVDEPLLDPIYQELTATLGVTLVRRGKRVARHLKQGNAKAALAEWEAAVRADPEWAEPLIQLGLLRAQLGDTDGAIEMFERALRLDPEQHQARNNLGGWLIERGAIDEGIALLRASTAAMPENPDARFNLARALSQQGRLDEAASVLRGARDLFPREARITLALAWILATAPDEQLRDGGAAMKLLDPLLRERRGFRLLDTYAAAQAATGDFAAAIHTADEAIAALRREGPGAAAALAEVESRRARYAREEPFVTIPETGPSRP